MIIINTIIFYLLLLRVSQYVEFDSTRQNFTNKLTNFVLKIPYVKMYYALKTNCVQSSTRRYVIETKKKILIKR